MSFQRAIANVVAERTDTPIPDEYMHWARLLDNVGANRNNETLMAAAFASFQSFLEWQNQHDDKMSLTSALPAEVLLLVIENLIRYGRIKPEHLQELVLVNRSLHILVDDNRKRLWQLFISTHYPMFQWPLNWREESADLLKKRYFALKFADQYYMSLKLFYEEERDFLPVHFDEDHDDVLLQLVGAQPDLLSFDLMKLGRTLQSSNVDWFLSESKSSVVDIIATEDKDYEFDWENAIDTEMVEELMQHINARDFMFMWNDIKMEKFIAPLLKRLYSTYVRFQELVFGGVAFVIRWLTSYGSTDIPIREFNNESEWNDILSRHERHFRDHLENIPEHELPRGDLIGIWRFYVLCYLIGVAYNRKRQEKQLRQNETRWRRLHSQANKRSRTE